MSGFLANSVYDVFAVGIWFAEVSVKALADLDDFEYKYPGNVSRNQYLPQFLGILVKNYYSGQTNSLSLSNLFLLCIRRTMFIQKSHFRADKNKSILVGTTLNLLICLSKYFVHKYINTLKCKLILVNNAQYC